MWLNVNDDQYTELRSNFDLMIDYHDVLCIHDSLSEFKLISLKEQINLLS